MVVSVVIRLVSLNQSGHSGHKNGQAGQNPPPITVFFPPGGLDQIRTRANPQSAHELIPRCPRGLDLLELGYLTTQRFGQWLISIRASAHRVPP